MAEKNLRFYMGDKGQACEHAFAGYDSLHPEFKTVCAACTDLLTKKGAPGMDITWFRNEFRRVIIAPGVVAFVPSTPDGKQRDGVVVRLHHDESATTAGKWLDGDRIFYYQLMERGGLPDGGFFNDRTQEKISVVR